MFLNAPIKITILNAKDDQTPFNRDDVNGELGFKSNNDNEIFSTMVRNEKPINAKDRKIANDAGGQN